MDEGIYLAGSRMNGLASSLDMVAANLANANTPGYKRTLGQFSALMHAMVAGAPAEGARPAWPVLTAGHLDLSQGPVQETGRPLDVAIRGPAFLALDTPAGRRYTRKGRIFLNADGEMVDAAGNRFAAQGGSLRVPVDAEKITIERTGEVLADDQLIGRLMLVEVPKPEFLVPEGSCLYRYDGPAPRRASGSELVQGSLEHSNVNVMAEMVNLVQLMRAYEANARVLKRLDEANSRTIESAA